MPNELNLQFPEKTRVVITLNGGVPTPALAFTNPLTEKDHADIRWYLETYGAHSLGDPDDKEARRIAGQLPIWGRALFNAVFSDPAAFKRFVAFQQMENDARLLTISAEDPSILVLPWELMHDPSKTGGFLFLETPRISIRRRVQGADDGRQPFEITPREQLHLLFVVSRPEDAGFLDPRADALAVLDAIDEHAPGRVTCEFLRPPTLDGLLKRLENKSRPAVDILHFDGHGVFDRHGGLLERAALKDLNGLSFQGAALKEVSGSAASPPNTGYLLFETPDGKRDLVSAAKLGANLHRHKVSLVILSACQSAAFGEDAQETNEIEDVEAEDRAMGSVAARLTATGIPSVLAMTHSVLVYTTRMLFGEFYRELAQSRTVGEALDNARRYLFNHPRRYDVQRGSVRVPLELGDWFLPALYQPGTDRPLLQECPDRLFDAVVPHTNVPSVPEAGFFGRRRALWEIERWFAGTTRRITITGFGGQGKTALALESARWLMRAGMFDSAVFVDYSRIQAEDAVAVAVSTIGEVLGASLTDADAVGRALGTRRTLVILDNLEALPQPSLQALLDAAAGWSDAGGSRVLCTTRRPTFGHPQYRVEGTVIHRRIVLDGLGSRKTPDDALEWYATLMKLPPPSIVKAPTRAEIVDLFDRVSFHPLSIRVLTQQLKSRRAAELSARLEELLASPAIGGEGEGGTSPSLLASLQLSLDRLDASARELLPRLGVFQGGAFEDDLCAVAGWDASAGDAWPTLRQQLEAAALIEAESLPGLSVPFLRFHPTLAPMLWSRLNDEERTRLTDAHRSNYYRLSAELYTADSRNPLAVRAVAWYELPNLLYAANNALDAHDPQAVDFADNVIRFLDLFGLRQEALRLTARVEASSGTEGSSDWFLVETNRGRRLLQSGNLQEAVKVFERILQQLGDTESYRRAATLGQLGRCFLTGGFAIDAEDYHRRALAEFRRLPQDDGVKQALAIELTDLGAALSQQGRYAEARSAYEEGLELKKELNDLVGQGVTHGQLATLAVRERANGWFEEATQRNYAALALFQQMKDPANEAATYHQLGRIFEEMRDWDEAEKHYRTAARIHDETGNLVGASVTWNQLAAVSAQAGKFDAAEQWFRKAIEGARQTNDIRRLSLRLSNLAALLRNVPGRLQAARELAEEALQIKISLGEDAPEIWNTYWILASIADREAEESNEGRSQELRAEARARRRLARQTQIEFPGARHQLRKHGALIAAAIGVTRSGPQSQFDETLVALQQLGWTNLVTAIRRMLAGETDAESLFDDLDSEDALIVEAILRGLADPSSIADLLPDPEPEAG